MMTVRLRALGGVGLVALCVAASACGSSSKKSSTAATPNGPTTVGAGPTSTASSTSVKVAGEPVKVTFITGTGVGTSGAEALPGIKAAEAAINRTTGVRGRPIQVTVCDGGSDANKAAECARNAVADNAQIAFVGNNHPQGAANIASVALAANMPNVGPKIFVPADYTNANSFTLEPGGLAPIAGNLILTKQGAAKIVLMYQAGAAGQTSLDFTTKQMTKQSGHGFVKSFAVPATVTDMTATAADALSSNPDVINCQATQSVMIVCVNAIRAQGYKGPILASGSSSSVDLIKNKIGAPNNAGMLNTTAYSKSSDGYTQFLSEVQAYDSSEVIQTDDQTITGWLAMHVFADVMSASTQPLTRDGVMNAFNAASDVKTHGLTPTIDFTKPNSDPSYPRIFNPNVLLAKVDGDHLVNLNQPATFINIFTLATTNPSN